MDGERQFIQRWRDPAQLAPGGADRRRGAGAGRALAALLYRYRRLAPAGGQQRAHPAAAAGSAGGSTRDLERQSQTDGLTGLANRRQFLTTCAAARTCASSARRAAEPAGWRISTISRYQRRYGMPLATTTCAPWVGAQISVDPAATDLWRPWRRGVQSACCPKPWPLMPRCWPSASRCQKDSMVLCPTSWPVPCTWIAEHEVATLLRRRKTDAFRCPGRRAAVSPLRRATACMRW